MRCPFIRCRRLAVVVALASFGAASPADAQTICGRTFSTVPDLIEKVKGSENAQLLSGASQYVAYSEPKEQIVWTFTAGTHPAQPAAVCRKILEKDGSFYVHMEVHCGATKPACDRLVEEFKNLNEQMREALKKKPK